MAQIAAVVAFTDEEKAKHLLRFVENAPAVNWLGVATPSKIALPFGKVDRLTTTELRSANGVIEALNWFESTGASHLMWLLSPLVELNALGLLRLFAVANDTRAALVYSDYFDRQSDGTAKLHPLIDYQSGSLRDDFDFGNMVLLSREAITGMAERIKTEGTACHYGGWYDLRLRVSERGHFLRLAEPTYVTFDQPPTIPNSSSVRTGQHLQHATGEAHFHYVDPRNREYQIEMERIATAHLKRIGVWLPPPTACPVQSKEHFAVEASVVIPVRNRARTIADAVRSALAQQTDFPFNVIVVDNHSTDDTSNVLSNLAARETRLIHLIPDRIDLGIGGCWNEAIYSKHCGRYAVQLDSDDLYAAPDVLSRIVAEFRRGRCAMVIGSYTIVDFNLQPIPPGLIDHREWTDENGHNNALRVAGLGAPRAFHVPTLRTIGFPNVSFGEDYAVALQLSRRYPVGRIYESVYWCRRWEGNTDHALPLETKNRYDSYKDRLRSIEIAARQR
jgi:hypothetical protein